VAAGAVSAVDPPPSRGAALWAMDAGGAGETSPDGDGSLLEGQGSPEGSDDAAGVSGLCVCCLCVCCLCVCVSVVCVSVCLCVCCLCVCVSVCLCGWCGLTKPLSHGAPASPVTLVTEMP
jgi:hypothetical protein